MKFGKLKFAAPATAAVLLLLAGPAKGDYIQYQATIPQMNVPYSSYTFTLPQFNAALGTLTQVVVTFQSSVVGSLTVFNPTGSALNLTGLSGSVPVTITESTLGTALTTTATASQTFAVPQAVQPGQSLVYSGLTISSTNSQTFTSSLGGYVGDGVTTLTYNAASANATASGTGDPGLLYGATAKAGGVATIGYTYTPVPEPTSYALLVLGSTVGILGRRALRRRA